MFSLNISDCQFRSLILRTFFTQNLFVCRVFQNIVVVRL